MNVAFAGQPQAARHNVGQQQKAQNAAVPQFGNKTQNAAAPMKAMDAAPKFGNGTKLNKLG